MAFLIFEVGMKMSARAKQAQLSNQKSKAINRKSIRSAGNVENLV
jgi:hypothetical protein